MPVSGSPHSRRRLLAAGIGAAALVGVRAGAQATTEVVVVSREGILLEARAARRLREAEEEMTARLQGQIDETKAEFAEEEAALTELRGTVPAAEFEARVADFDQRVRLARRVAQERAAILQKGFQDARAAIVAALPALMERLRIEAGARVIVNADQVLAADPAIDLTERAVALFDAEGPMPAIPEIDLSRPLVEPQPEPPGAPGSGVQSGPQSGPLSGPQSPARPAAPAPGR
jgi:Skp family chaperone for outer membrane proteins